VAGRHENDVQPPPVRGEDPAVALESDPPRWEHQQRAVSGARWTSLLDVLTDSVGCGLANALSGMSYSRAEPQARLDTFPRVVIALTILGGHVGLAATSTSAGRHASPAHACNAVVDEHDVPTFNRHNLDQARGHTRARETGLIVRQGGPDRCAQITAHCQRRAIRMMLLS
jgi:hypothetical protein